MQPGAGSLVADPNIGPELLDETVVIMAAKLRQARANGCLKDCLEQMNLLELLRKDRPVQLSDEPAPEQAARKERSS